MVGPVHRILGQRHVAAGREDLDLVGEEVQQHRRQPEHRHRDAHQRKDCQRTVGEPAGVHGAEVAEQHRQRHPDHRGADAQRERGGQALPRSAPRRCESFAYDISSPVKICFIIVRYCTGSGSSRPSLSHARDQRRVGVLARDALAAGSEFGITLKIRNTITEIANSTATMPSRRLDDEAGHRLSAPA